jgi:hypothetical protein
MKNFKLKKGFSEVFVINKDVFRAKTNEKPPYYSQNEKGELVCFAICPVCNNPIQLKGLYHRKNNSPQPYGSHIKKDIPNLANYNKTTVKYCRYSDNRKNFSPRENKAEMDENSIEIYNTFRNNFVKTVNLLRKSMDINFSQKIIFQARVTSILVQIC